MRRAAAGSWRSSVGICDKPMNMWRVGGCYRLASVCPGRLERLISRREEARARHVPRAKAQGEKNRGLIQILRVEILPIFKLHVQYCIDQVVVSQWTSCRRRLPRRLGDDTSEKDVTIAKSHRRPHDKARESFALLLTRWSSSGRDGNAT
jgi:hypothetical protein